MTEIQCTRCGRSLKEFDLESGEEGDEMWFFPLNDGEGGEGVICANCWNKDQ